MSLSVSLYVLPEMTIAGDDIFLSALFGGILSGVGTGILFAAIYAVGRVSDGILDGLNFSKLAIIISERNKEIAGSIMKNMERGVTAVKSVGMYSGTERDMLFCVVPRKEIVWLQSK